MLTNFLPFFSAKLPYAMPYGSNMSNDAKYYFDLNLSCLLLNINSQILKCQKYFLLKHQLFLDHTNKK